MLFTIVFWVLGSVVKGTVFTGGGRIGVAGPEIPSHPGSETSYNNRELHGRPKQAPTRTAKPK